MSMLRHNATNFILRSGRNFTAASGATVVGRLMPVKAIGRIAGTGEKNPFVNAVNVSEFLTTPDVDSLAGTVLYDATNSIRWLLYARYKHYVGSVVSYCMYHALRANVSSVTVQRWDVTKAGPAGGLKKILLSAAVASGLYGHFYEALESLKSIKEGRTETALAKLVIPASATIQVGDLVSFSGKRYEITGYDALALDGLWVCTLVRAK